MAGLWPNGIYGAPVTAAVTFTEDDDGRWVLLLDAPWKRDGLNVGAFEGLLDGAAFVYGPAPFQLRLPMGIA